MYNLKNIGVKHLKLATVLRKTGSLTETGKRLNLSQPAISHQLKALESFIGAPLFERQGKRLIANPAGAFFSEKSDEILSEIEHTMKSARQMIYGRDLKLRLSLECSTCYSWLPYVIKEFNQYYPTTQIEIVSSASGEVHERLANREVDLGIVASKFEKDGLQYHPIFSDDLVLLVNENNPLADRSCVRIEETILEHWLLYSGTRKKYLQTFFSDAGLDSPAQVTELPLTEAIADWVNAGLGVSAMASWAARPFLIGRKNIRSVNITTETFLCRDWYVSTAFLDIPQSWHKFIDIIKQAPPTKADYTENPIFASEVYLDNDAQHLDLSVSP